MFEHIKLNDILPALWYNAPVAMLWVQPVQWIVIHIAQTDWGIQPTMIQSTGEVLEINWLLNRVICIRLDNWPKCQGWETHLRTRRGGLQNQNARSERLIYGQEEVDCWAKMPGASNTSTYKTKWTAESKCQGWEIHLRTRRDGLLSQNARGERFIYGQDEVACRAKIPGVWCVNVRRVVCECKNSCSFCLYKINTVSYVSHHIRDCP